MKYLTRTIWILSFISLFTDIASEMLYPIMPIYLRSIGFSVLLIGILEGISEATAGLSKGYFGKLSDQTGRRAPFIRLGYALSALSKPMMAAFIYPLWIFFSRSLSFFRFSFFSVTLILALNMDLTDWRKARNSTHHPKSMVIAYCFETYGR